VVFSEHGDAKAKLSWCCELVRLVSSEKIGVKAKPCYWREFVS